ncbi:MAG: hypothetical protein C0506_07135 [Anaerolinea sp.]|nr:hypothetical protein [Anaerolinea sp.]
MGEKESASGTEAGRMKAGLDTAGGALATGAARQTPKRDFGDMARTAEPGDSGDGPGDKGEKQLYQHNQTDMDFIR